jgi:thymidylate synthase
MSSDEEDAEDLVEDFDRWASFDEVYSVAVNHILTLKQERNNRTGVNTLSDGSMFIELDLRKGFPLLSSKKIFLRGVAEELFWFISGKTDTKILHDKGVKIWDEWTTREFLDKRGLHHYRVGDIGPSYPFQWRHAGAVYKGCDEDYTGQGIDQLANVIHTLKTDNHDRRMIVESWNVADIPKMALPPCHHNFQFFVRHLKDGTDVLDCFMKMRSCDVGVGLPFNVPSYALLTHLVAHTVGLGVGLLSICSVDTHIYVNHIKALKEQMTRDFRPAPQLFIKGPPKDISDYRFEDLELIGYDPHPAIPMDVAV